MAKSKTKGIRPFRKPDFEVGNMAVWWGPSKDPKEAEAFTVVEGEEVSEYTFVGGYEGYEDDQWLVTTTRPSHQSKDVRYLAAHGVEEIANRGGEESIMSNDEVMSEFGDLAPRKTNPSKSTNGNPMKMTREEFTEYFENEALPLIAQQYEQDGVPDKPARREAWNGLIDFYIRGGQLPRSSEGWVIPKRLETKKVKARTPSKKLRSRNPGNKRSKASSRKGNTHDPRKSYRRFHYAVEDAQRYLTSAVVNTMKKKYTEAAHSLILAAFLSGQAQAQSEYVSDLDKKEQAEFDALMERLEEMVSGINGDWGKTLVRSIKGSSTNPSGTKSGPKSSSKAKAGPKKAKQSSKKTIKIKDTVYKVHETVGPPNHRVTILETPDGETVWEDTQVLINEYDFNP